MPATGHASRKTNAFASLMNTSDQNHIVAMDQFRLVDVTEQFLDLVGWPAENPLRLDSTGVHQATGNFLPLGPHATHPSAPPETTGHRLHTHRQQTPMSLSQGMYGTRIQRQGSASLEMPRQPLLASGMPAALGR